MVNDLARLWLRHHQGPPLGSSGQHPEVAHGVKPGRRHERDEAAEERERVKLTATVPSLNGFFRAMRTSPSGPGGSRSLANRWAQDVLQQRLPSLLVGRSGAGRGVQAEAGFAQREWRVDDHAGAAREGELAWLAT